MEGGSRSQCLRPCTCTTTLRRGTGRGAGGGSVAAALARAHSRPEGDTTARGCWRVSTVALERRQLLDMLCTAEGFS